MKQTKIYAVPIGVANVDSDEEFKKQARQFGYVWASSNMLKEHSLYGLVIKVILE